MWTDRNVEIAHRDLGIEIDKILEENNKLKYLFQEFYPRIKQESEQALAMGPKPDGHHCDPECGDCEWYNWGVSFQQRIDKGEFNEFNS